MIGASIKRARLANCLSLQQLVDRMKDNGVAITKTTLFNYEAGSIIPSDNLLEIFGQVLGVNKNFFFHTLPENFNIELTEELGSVDARRQELLAYIQIQLGQLIQVIQICRFDTCLFHFAHKSVRFYILYTLRLLHCSYTKSID